ncbi:MAG: hypothetical protein GX868_07350, partial [Actinobacteria bacterium]|nr:hypothetical protein [Actinomycetota bacterium]
MDQTIVNRRAGARAAHAWLALLVGMTMALLGACVADAGNSGTGSTPDLATSTARGVVASLRGDGIDLTWRAEPGAEPFVVEWRKAGTAAWTGSLDAPTTAARVTGLTPNTTYRFRVRSAAADPVTGWSGIVSRGYFEPTLPIVTINTVDRQRILDKENYVAGQFELDPNSHDVAAYSGTTEIRGRGNSTWNLDKKPYRLRLATKAPLMGMPSDRHWVLLANAYDNSQIRNVAAFALAGETGLGWVPRLRHVEVILNGRYEGVYLLGEHVRVSPNRVDIDEMGPADISGEALTGGYNLELDTRLEQNHEPGFRTATYNVPIVVKDPDPAAPEQMNYAKALLDAFEAALASEQFTDPVLGYRAHIDVASWIDYYLIAEVTRQQDAFQSSTFLNKDRGEQLRFGQVWDFDLSAGREATVTSNGLTSGWTVLDRNLSPWVARAVQDPWFVAAVRARWEVLKP